MTDRRLGQVGDKEDQVSFIDKRTHTIIGKPCPFKMEINEISWNNSGASALFSTAICVPFPACTHCQLSGACATCGYSALAGNLFFLTTGNGTVDVFNYGEGGGASSTCTQRCSHW